MTENEWNKSHPAQAVAYVEAWTNKQKREDQRLASLELTIAQSQGVKINGRKPTLTDFLPEYAKPKKRKRSPEEQEAELKSAFAALAARKKPNGQ